MSSQFPQRKQPVTYSDTIADEIITRLSDGETLKNILKSEYMPDNSTWLMWCRDRPDLALRYAQARLAMFYSWADDLIDLADDSTGDYGSTPDRKRGKGEQLIFLRENVERTKLKIETRKWLMKTLAAAHFGDGTTRSAGDTSASALSNVSGRELVQQVAVYAQALGAPFPPDVLRRMLVECGGMDEPARPSAALPMM